MADLRKALETALDEIAEQPDEVRKLVLEMVSAEKEREVWVPVTCKHCGRDGKYQTLIPLPDHKERAKALEILLNQGKGRPAQPIDLNAKVELTMNKPVGSLTLEELRLEIDYILEKQYARDPDGFLRQRRDEWAAENEWRRSEPGQYLPLPESVKLERLPPSIRDEPGIIERIETLDAPPSRKGKARKDV